VSKPGARRPLSVTFDCLDGRRRRGITPRDETIRRGCPPVETTKSELVLRSWPDCRLTTIWLQSISTRHTVKFAHPPASGFLSTCSSISLTWSKCCSGGKHAHEVTKGDTDRNVFTHVSHFASIHFNSYACCVCAYGKKRERNDNSRIQCDKMITCSKSAVYREYCAFSDAKFIT